MKIPTTGAAIKYPEIYKKHVEAGKSSRQDSRKGMKQDDLGDRYGEGRQCPCGMPPA